MRREDGSWLINGMIPLEKIFDIIPDVEQVFFPGDFQTLGGVMMGELGHVPRAGEKVAPGFFDLITPGSSLSDQPRPSNSQI